MNVRVEYSITINLFPLYQRFSKWAVRPTGDGRASFGGMKPRMKKVWGGDMG